MNDINDILKGEGGAGHEGWKCLGGVEGGWGGEVVGTKVRTREELEGVDMSYSNKTFHTFQNFKNFSPVFLRSFICFCSV